jgi:hypothetical protein
MAFVCIPWRWLRVSAGTRCSNFYIHLYLCSKSEWIHISVLQIARKMYSIEYYLVMCALSCVIESVKFWKSTRQYSELRELHEWQQKWRDVFLTMDESAKDSVKVFCEIWGSSIQVIWEVAAWRVSTYWNGGGASLLPEIDNYLPVGTK